MKKTDERRGDKRIEEERSGQRGENRTSEKNRVEEKGILPRNKYTI